MKQNQRHAHSLSLCGLVVSLSVLLPSQAQATVTNTPKALAISTNKYSEHAISNTSPLFQQDLKADKLQGTVVDEKGEPVTGATVKVKGTGVGAVTDMDGRFTITAKPGTLLIISYVGYTDVQVKGTQNMRVRLKNSTENLNEVVVVAYGTSRKRDVTGALSSFKPNENDAMKSVSIDNLLNGKVAGLVVNTASSAVGAASSVTIRGASSLRGDNQPLYVIDNIPQASTGEFSGSGIGGDYQIAQDPLSALNPNDIEDITILKDASSTAIYGSRGANGVILITTKKGHKSKTKVNVSANFTVANTAKQLDMMDLTQYASYANSRYTNTTATPFHLVGNEIRYVFSGSYDKYDPNDPETYRLVKYRNWQKEIYRSALSQNYSASLSFGTGKVNYYFSANYKNINGTVKQTSLQQGDLRMNLNAKLSKTVKLDFSISGSLRKNDMMAGGNTLGGSTGAVSRTAIDYAPFQMPDDDPSFSNENKTTVFSWLSDYTDDTTDKSLKGSLNLTWNILPNLSYNLRTGGNQNHNQRTRFYGLQLYQGMNNNGLLNLGELKKSNYSVENILNYNMKFAKVGKLDLTGGITFEDYNYLYKNRLGNQYTINDDGKFVNTNGNVIAPASWDGIDYAGVVITATPWQKDYQLLSYLGRANFALYDRYLLTASIRADGSSKFAKGHRWGYFPSASVAWRVEEEAFMKPLTWVSQLKLRLSYGVTGNQSIDPYSTFAMYQSLVNNFYADGHGKKQDAYSVTNLANNGLTWEKTGSWNVGVDFSLFKTRLSGTLDLYQKKTTDLLISRNLPGSAGFAATYYNQGALTNQGVEFALNAQIIDGKRWKWNLKGNIAKNHSKIVDLGLDPSDFGSLGKRVGYYGNSLGDHFGVGHIFLQGEQPGQFFGYKTQGIIQTDDITPEGVKFTKPDGSIGYYTLFNNVKPKAGDVKVVDMNNDGTIDANDRTIIGNPNAGFTYGFYTQVSWKSMSLSASFIGVHGREVLNTNNRYIATPGTRTNSLLKVAYENMWTEKHPSNVYPSSTYVVGNYVYDRYIEDASYLRCSDITLSYNIGRKTMKKIGMSNASAYLSVKNAFLITDYSGYDPEVNSFAFDGLRPGVDMNSYPNSRSFVLGLNLIF